MFICMDEAMAGQDAHGLALAQAVQIILVWSDQAFLAGRAFRGLRWCSGLKARNSSGHSRRL